MIPEKFGCDYYRFLQGDPIAVNAFQNDYMLSYSWAEIRNAEPVSYTHLHYYSKGEKKKLIQSAVILSGHGQQKYRTEDG